MWMYTFTYSIFFLISWFGIILVANRWGYGLVFFWNFLYKRKIFLKYIVKKIFRMRLSNFWLPVFNYLQILYLFCFSLIYSYYFFFNFLFYFLWFLFNNRTNDLDLILTSGLLILDNFEDRFFYMVDVFIFITNYFIIAFLDF